MLPFHLVKKKDGRKVAVASTDILAGTLLFSEDALVKFRNIFPQRDAHGVKAPSLSFIETIEQLPADQMKKYLGIFAPDLPMVEPMYAQLLMQRPELMLQMGRTCKVLSIYISNNVFLPIHNKVVNAAIYETWSYVQHSCDGNCYRSFSEDPGSFISYCRAGRNIKAGETLTLCKTEDPMNETHIRRCAILSKFGFTCHCPRCDAEGDDTRQFECFDRTCLGRHYVREPEHSSSCMKMGISDSYDVPYETPRLLPCTDCHRTPPPQYQQRCLRMEKHLAKELSRIRKATDAKGVTGAQLLDLFEEVLFLPLPQHHSLVYRAVMVRQHVAMLFCQACPKAPYPDLFDDSFDADFHTALETECILPGVSDAVRNAWSNLVAHATTCRRPAHVVKLAVQKCMRLQCVTKGREYREDIWDQALVKALRGLPVPQEVVDMTVCAFCEESPDHADMKRSRCGACRELLYCSKGCQKAHWPLHKQQCAKK